MNKIVSKSEVGLNNISSLSNKKKTDNVSKINNDDGLINSDVDDSVSSEDEFDFNDSQDKKVLISIKEDDSSESEDDENNNENNTGILDKKLVKMDDDEEHITYLGKKFFNDTRKAKRKKNGKIRYKCCNYRKDEEDYKDKERFCDSYIRYDPNDGSYNMIVAHSVACIEFKKEVALNIIKVDNEIINYDNFRNLMINYLSDNFEIKLKDLEKAGKKLYNKSKCNFTLKNIQ